MSSNGFSNENKSFIYYDNHWLCAWCIAHWYTVLLPNWKIIWRNYTCKIKQDYFLFLCSRFPPSSFLFLFYPIFFISHTTQLISSHLLSLGDLSAPYRSAPVPCWFFSLIFSSSPQTSPSPSSCTLFVLYPVCLCHVCFFFFFSSSHIISSILTISYLPLLMCPPASLPHALSPLSCGSWALCGDASPKTALLLPLLFPWR